jgi:hypothetical protein
LEVFLFDFGGFFCFLFCFVGTGFKLKASHLQSKCITVCTTSLVHFALVSLEIGFC